jgi:mannose-6-phosphate isomerase
MLFGPLRSSLASVVSPERNSLGVMERISGTVQSYAWGSTTALASLRGIDPTGQPEAELWFGSHPSAPSRLVANGEPIDDLPFLVKILAAGAPLSIQTHPNLAQARAGFAREEAAGLPLGAPTRTYRDANHKPEIIIALTEFEALCGFRPAAEIASVFRSFGTAHLRTLGDGLAPTPEGIRELLAMLFNLGPDDRAQLVEGLVRVCERPSYGANDTAQLVLRLNTFYPGDVGCVVALMLNHITLAPGQAIFLAAGNLHAYIGGMGVEVMATSDNVVRGGLTPKHIDVPEMMRVVDPTPLLDPVFRPVVDATPGVETVHFHPPVTDFAVDRITLEGASTTWTATHNEIVLCTAGSVNGLGPSDAALVRAGEHVELRGRGVVWRVRQPDQAAR